MVVRKCMACYSPAMAGPTVATCRWCSALQCKGGKGCVLLQWWVEVCVLLPWLLS